MFFYDTFLMGAPADGQANPLAMFLPLILIFIVFYFFIIRPQKKKEDQRKKMIEAVKKGDRIVTIGGVHGTVTQVDETSVLAQVDSNTKLRIEKNAIATVIGKDKE
ncbi:preprotein translocase subunit YajC [Rhodocaloribacter litoris]|uniref:preprotein translocase subunit YajC n=1 Tax=Rhodocaloribacter litoris TaxID=2558931 RepID=UPI00141FED43|nr:preprotein translocase subunit YajC [Rhodocaloribacter litoris]QXD14603.1 preprotein translocase subunit YajC [Rhodocaloribacter litoris]GIV59626.1 MAG: preprotein translocase subunit YajC [Rhodothermaceae bacterium]